MRNEVCGSVWKGLFLGALLVGNLPSARAFTPEVHGATQVVAGTNMSSGSDQSATSASFSADVTSNFGGTASASATVTYGHVSASGQTVGSVGHGFHLGTVDAARVDLSGSWTDELTVLGPPGQFTNVTVTSSITSIGSCSSRDPGLLCGASLQGDIFSPLSGLHHFLVHAENGGNTQDTNTISLFVKTGDKIDINNIAFTMVVNSYLELAVSNVDATATMFLDSTNPLFSLQAASGRNYATDAPVPLPGSLGLLAVSLLALGKRMIRRENS